MYGGLTMHVKVFVQRQTNRQTDRQTDREDGHT